MLNQEIISTCAFIVTLLTSLGALVISWKAFNRQRTLESENQFHEFKLRKYEIIIGLMIELHDLYSDGVNEALEKRGLLSMIFDSNKIPDRIDKKTNEFRLALYKNASFLPENVVLKLDEFYESLYVTDVSQQIETKNRNALQKMTPIIAQMNDDIDRIINLMRDDLAIGQLDTSLKRRLRFKERGL